jgi:AraC-like DNA-binding protein
VTITSPQVERALHPGDLFIFQPENAFHYSKAQGVEMEYYWVHFTGYWACELLKQCGIETNQIMTPGVHERICDKFRRLFEVFLTRDSFFELDAAHKLYSILLDMGKCILDQIADPSQNRSRINRSLSYIHDHLSQAISVSFLAATEHMSVSHFRAVFHQITGLSPQDYITLSKLNYSCELLRQTDLSIKEVGESVGYSDPQYFNRIFRKHFGLPPGAYRNQNKNQFSLSSSLH